jgi:hypothetical protein
LDMRVAASKASLFCVTLGSRRPDLLESRVFAFQ